MSWSNLMWFILLHYVYIATNNYPSNMTLFFNVIAATCFSLYEAVLKAVQDCVKRKYSIKS